MKKDDKQAFAYYSRLLKEPFDSIEELAEAEEAYYAKLKAKEDKAAAKKADAVKVEEAFKSLNAARKNYKETLEVITENYRKNLVELKAAFEEDTAAANKALALAEEAYDVALKTFTEKYPEGFHLTLKDGDFETTISSSKTTSNDTYKIADLFDWLFN